MVEGLLRCPSGKRVTGRRKAPAEGNLCSSSVTKKNIAMCNHQCNEEKYCYVSKISFYSKRGGSVGVHSVAYRSSSSQFFSDFIYVSKELVIRCWLLLVSVPKVCYKVHVNTLSAFLKLISLERNCVTVTVLCSH